MRLLVVMLCIGIALASEAQRFEPNAHAYSCQANKMGRKPKPDTYKAANSRTDSFNVIHYNIELGIIDLSQRRIDGTCTITAVSNIDGLAYIDLDLLSLSVSSVVVQGLTGSFTHSGELLRIDLPFNLNIGDTAVLVVNYGGQPITDASGWGGFYFSSGYAYNLGVGFAADPHNYGRVWFPCVDNFIDKATYDFYITTAETNKAYCNGILQGTTNMPGVITWHWKLTDPISTYLVSIAVSDYTELNSTYYGIADSFPVVLAARAADTANLALSFANLDGAINAFELGYGPQPFERVGFVLVPFSSGAMEHATNIAYPRYAANGSLAQESLMAHELAHHWWGDNVTCETQEDMWLNEGWASYSEHLFFEQVYDYETYLDKVRENHFDVLRMAHINDDGFRAVSGVPHEFTYGDHVYNKGADVIHALRSYMGDANFFECITQFQQQYAYQNANSSEFRDFLTNCSGVDLTAYFDNWIFSPGFAHFSVDSLTVVGDSLNNDVVVYLRQRLRSAPAYFSNVPVELTYYGANWEVFTETANISGFCGIYYSNVPFEPVFVAVDLNEKITDATTDAYYIMTDTGYYDFGEALFEMNVSQLQDSAIVRVEHNWVAPDPLVPAVSGLHLSLERYYKVDGIFPNGFAATASFPFDGTQSSTTGYLDNQLLKSGSEDSLVLLYRRGSSFEWAAHPDYSINTMGSSTNKKGEVLINALVPGEYALGIYDASRADSVHVIPNPAPCRVVSEIESIEAGTVLNIYPNPAHDSFFVALTAALTDNAEVTVYDLSGRQVFASIIAVGETEIEVNTSGWGKGLFIVKYSAKDIQQFKRIVVIE